MTDLVIPKYIGGYKVTSIDNNAFKYCQELISVTIPDSVTSIGSYAFYDCASLTSVTIPDSVTSIGTRAFGYCGGLESIDIPEGIDYIGEGVFEYCSSLTSVVIPEGVTSIDSHAFYYCTNLASVVIPEGVTHIGSYAFSDCWDITSIVIPDSVTYIDSYAFLDCGYLTTVILGSGVEYINYCAFEGCSDISDVYYKGTKSDWDTISISSWNTYLTDAKRYYYSESEPTESGLFWRYVDGEPTAWTPVGHGYALSYTVNDDGLTCYITGLLDESITDLVIPAYIDGYEVMGIGGYAFEYCDTLTSIAIPYTVTYIGYRSFSGCDNLETVYITDLAAWLSIEFSNAQNHPCNGGADLYLNGAPIVDVVIPDEVETIGSFAFKGCHDLVSVIIPEGITDIGYAAFFYCYDLEWIVIPESVDYVTESAFSACSSLETVYYKGTQKDWNNLYIESYNSALTDATVYYYSETPAETAYTHWRFVDDVPTVWSEAHIHRMGEDGKCTECGKNLVNTIEYTFELHYYDNGYYVTGATGEDLSTIVIPSEYNGLPVIGIGYYAFSYNNDIETVIIPEGVIYIDSYAFYNCENLISVVIPESLLDIYYCAFDDCYSLTTVFYNGDEEGWYNITMGSYTSYVQYASRYYYSEIIPTTTYTHWHYVDGVPTIWTESHSHVRGEDGFCTICGLDVSYTHELIFELDYETGEFYRVTGISDHYITEVIIPATYNGLPVTEIGYEAFFYRSNIETIIIPDSVTCIGKNAFYYCTGLVNVTLPASLTTIEVGAFIGCQSLESITIPESVTAIKSETFYCCENLREITLHDGITSIGSYAFYYCKNLESIILPAHLSRIERNTFYDCYNLQSILIPSSVSFIGYAAFYDCYPSTIYYGGSSESEWSKIDRESYNYSLDYNALRYYSEVIPTEAYTYWRFVDGIPTVWEEGHDHERDENGICIICGRDLNYTQELTYAINPDGESYRVTGLSTLEGITEVSIPAVYNGKPVTTIDEYAFSFNDQLTKITLPDSIVYIGEYAFQYCSSLTSIVLPDSLTTIGEGAFLECYNLESITFGEGLTTIEEFAFQYCSGITSIILPDSLISICYGAFYECDGLESVTFGEGLTTIGEYAFSRCENLTSVVLHDSLTNIGEFAFEFCYDLTSVEIGEGLTTLNSGVFYYCTNLSSVTINGDLTAIGGSTFGSCESLTSIVIPDTVSYIGEGAFDWCWKLNTVYYEGSQSNWSNIYIEYWNTYLISATRYYYSESEPTTGGLYWHYVDGVPTAW